MKRSNEDTLKYHQSNRRLNMNPIGTAFTKQELSTTRWPDDSQTKFDY